MEIRIGIANIGRELNFESDQSAQQVQDTIAQALESKASSVTFSDSKGSTYIVPTASLAYVEVGTDQTRRVGFVA